MSTLHIRLTFLTLALGLLQAASQDKPAAPVPDSPHSSITAYRSELAAFRKEYGGSYELPDVRFYLFGMGLRAKFIYRDGKLLDALSGNVVREWKIAGDEIHPSEYRVDLRTVDGTEISIREDEKALWIEEEGRSTALEGTRSPVVLPTFSENRFPRVLRVLHHELLMNVTPAGPLPNFFVYAKPWYRDGAMMALAFKETGNVDIIRDWILGLSDPYDRNNRGETEADNLGQALYLISLVSDRTHPLVAKVLAEAPRFEVNDGDSKFIKGRSDFSEHPVYQTKWLKYGLRALGLPDPYTIPLMEDSYSALFWMDYKDVHVKGKDHDDRGEYPYLGWACDHFYGAKKSPISNCDYPLTWEAKASGANYDGLKVLDPAYVTGKISPPHTWHAAEVFLHVLTSGRAGQEGAK